jgi:hypothetical protein
MQPSITLAIEASSWSLELRANQAKRAVDRITRRRDSRARMKARGGFADASRYCR